MQRKYGVRGGVLCLAILAVAALIPSASANVIGHLDFANCASGGVTVTLTTIDFLLPVLGGTGCIAAGAGTTVTSSSGTINPGDLGTVNDLGFIPAGNAGFITFGGIKFNLQLAGPGPGVLNTICTNLFDPNQPACSVQTGSPFILTPTATGTTVTLSARGLASDSTSSNSPWLGGFTTQFAGETPAFIQNQILTTGTITTTSTYSFDGIVSQVPEPVSMALIGGGLLAIAGFKRRKLRAL